MRRITATIVTTLTLLIGIGTAHAVQAPKPTHSPTVTRTEVIPKERQPTIKFRHGDISWLPQLAAEAGWPPRTWKRLGQIVLRESGACPYRRGGDIVNKNCEVTGHDGSNHASDSGLLQINGINYNPKRNKYAPICTQMKICTQEPLLDALTNLKAGLLLFRATGSDWSPWIVPEGGW
tara:strand:+ start:719 stop:1252 length:534 start_codon:yes stop_codon:yes gene_type:complete